jgi:hypothetical protein
MLLVLLLCFGFASYSAYAGVPTAGTATAASNCVGQLHSSTEAVPVPEAAVASGNWEAAVAATAALVSSHGCAMSSSRQTPRLLPLLLLACLLACTAEAGSRQLLQSQTRHINVAWTIGLQCDHPWLRNATYNFEDKLEKASLADLTAFAGVSNAKFVGKGPCREIVAVRAQIE